MILNLSYTVMFIISLIYLFILVFCFKNKVSHYYILLFVAILITNFGYMQMSDADTIQASVLTNQTTYLGSCYGPYFMIMCLSDFCKIKLNKLVNIIYVVLGTFLFINVSCVGFVDWYYKDVSVINSHGIFMLMKEYGPLHFIYPAYLLGSSIFGLGIVGWTIFNKRDVSYITSTVLVFLMVIGCGAYIVERKLALNIPIIPFTYLISESGFLLLLYRIKLYNVTSISSAAVAVSKINGFLIFDSSGKYLGCDSTSAEWFPELKYLYVDRRPNYDNATDFVAVIGRWMNKKEGKTSVYFERNGKFYEIQHSVVKERKFRKIHVFYIRDDTKQQNYTKLVEHEVDEKTKKLKDIQEDIIISMASIVENRDNNTGGHIRRTSDIVKIFVQYLQETGNYPHLNEKLANNIVKAAPLHDFGKIAVPDNILNKPGKFTDEEYEIMKTHSEKGAHVVAQILKNSDEIDFKTVAINVAHYHHEKWNGMGYPSHLKEREIPFEARVMALADVFDALVSKRVYKDSFDYDKAFSIIKESGGSHFDPELCKDFLQCRQKLEELYNGYSD